MQNPKVPALQARLDALYTVTFHDELSELDLGKHQQIRPLDLEVEIARRTEGVILTVYNLDGSEVAAVQLEYWGGKLRLLMWDDSDIVEGDPEVRVLAEAKDIFRIDSVEDTYDSD